MMKLCTFHLWLALSICNASAKGTIRKKVESPTTVCVIEKVEFEMEDQTDVDKIKCVFDNSLIRYEILGLDDSFWSLHPDVGSRTHSLTLYENEIQMTQPQPGSGSTGAIVNISGEGTVASVDLLPGIVMKPLSGISIPAPGANSGRNRKLSEQVNKRSIRRTLIEGTRDVLIVRVTDQTGDEVQHSRAQIATNVFFDPQNLANRYRQCSGSKVDMVPASGPDIVDGVLDVTIPNTVSGETASTVEYWVSDYIENNVSLPNFNSYKHKMYILPRSVNFEGAAAYAYLNSDLSVYQERYYSHLQVLVHEIGHNLNHRHSGVYNSVTGAQEPYGDGTCMMGAAVFKDDIPRMCFNAAKSYNFGWYEERHAYFNPLSEYFYGKLVGIDDYVNGQIPPTSPDYHVIVKGGDNLFLMYNRKEGINDEVQAHPDKVTITTQDASEYIGEQSWNWAGLDEGEEYRYPDIYGIGNDLMVKVCEKASGVPDYATVLVYLEGYQYPNGEMDPTCAQATPWQSPPPTQAPSPPPTGACEDYPPGWYDADGPRYNCEWYAAGTHCQSYGNYYARDGYTANQACCVCGGGINPTAPPNPSPTASPTPSPTSPPTHSPTASPTRSPTVPPSPSPTAPPSPSPTPPPSPSPTPPPSPSPTPPPSPSPTASPTPLPTASPTPLPTAPPTLVPSSSPPTSSGPGAFGDPHMKLWNGETYDFHGICDMVLLQNTGFGNGLGMQIHIRTKKIQQWSYISNAVLLIDDESFEVMGTSRGNKYWINVVAGSKLHGYDMDLPEGISGFNIHYKRLHSQQKEYTVDLTGGEKIVFTTWKQMIRVSVVGATAENFDGSLGLMGTYKNGLKMARDNSTVIDDLMRFGEEWQVLPSEPKLFHNIEGPQAPMRCDIPSKTTTRRRLAGSTVTLKVAEQACAGISNRRERDACVFDVMAIGDTSISEMY